jgi:glycosyltransferase involved in cell wall biosynthesis
VDVVITDPYNLPLESNSVDVVVCSSCFEHSEFFWLLFIEIQRILKPDGLFYLNVPSNGVFHRYPVDCWRFYPDSGIALQNWGRKNGYNTALLESFTGKQKQDIWNDFVAVFLKDSAFVEKYTNPMQTEYRNFTNGLVYSRDGDFHHHQEQPEDFKIIRDLESKVHGLDAENTSRLQTIHDLQGKVDTLDSESVSRLQTIHDLQGKLTEEVESHQLLAHQYQALTDYVNHKNLDLRTAESVFKKMYKHRLRKYALRLLLGKKMNRRIRRWLRNANLGDPNIVDISSGVVPYDAPTDLSGAKVSIVLATYNGEKYLKEQLDSLLSQSHKNIEILIGDDQSTDGTVSIVKEYQKNNPFIHVYQHEENLGCDKNFEFLCSKAEGEYIAFSDQDDLWHQDKIKHLLQNIGDCDLAYGPSQLVNRDGFDLGKTLLQRNGIMPLEGKLMKGLMRHNTISGHAMLCKASFIKQNVPIHVSRINGHDDIFFDYYFALCANFQNGIKYVPEAITFHRMHDNNLTNNKNFIKNKHDEPNKNISRRLARKNKKNTINRLRWSV